MRQSVRMDQTVATLLGSAEACVVLGVNRSTLTRWVKAGRLHAHTKLPGGNGAYLFEREAIEALIQERAS